VTARISRLEPQIEVAGNVKPTPAESSRKLAKDKASAILSVVRAAAWEDVARRSFTTEYAVGSTEEV
jgi:hypothetical protein